MSKLFFIGFLFAILLGCQQDNKEDIQPEYKDWYALKAPEAQPIQAVYGDIDGTLVVATLFNIYLTNDRGKTWHKPNYNPGLTHGLFGFVSINDTLMVLDGKRKIEGDPVYYGSDPFYYSVDQGENWQYFEKSRRINLPLNVLKTPSGTTYAINEVLTPKSSSSTEKEYYVETLGIKVSDGRLLDLPQKHQIKSIYFDKKQRLYVAASAAVCGTLEKFEFCGEQNGILYISKKTQP